MEEQATAQTAPKKQDQKALNQAAGEPSAVPLVVRLLGCSVGNCSIPCHPQHLLSSLQSLDFSAKQTKDWDSCTQRLFSEGASLLPHLSSSWSTDCKEDQERSVHRDACCAPRSPACSSPVTGSQCHPVCKQTFPLLSRTAT